MCNRLVNRRSEQVACAVDSADEGCIWIVGAEFSSDLTNQNVDVPVVRIPFSVTNLVHKLVSVQHSSCIVD